MVRERSRGGSDVVRSPKWKEMETQAHSDLAPFAFSKLLLERPKKGIFNENKE